MFVAKKRKRFAPSYRSDRQVNNDPSISLRHKE